MSQRETDLDRLTTLLGQCLGRIDEQAYRLQQLGDDEDDFAAADVLEQEAAALQELVGALATSETQPESADLNRIVAQALQGCLEELAVPVVIRQRLAVDLPPVACGPGQVAFAVRRALTLALTRVTAGTEVTVATHRHGDAVVFELEAPCRERDRHWPERTATLCEFVQGLHGDCRIETEGGALLVAIELPTAAALDEA